MQQQTMQAIRVYAYGGPEQLTVEQIARPVPQVGEVLVRVMAAGVNPVDWKIRQGLYLDLFPKHFPYVPGGDFAGIVDQVGPGVTAVEPGQAVYGYTPNGVYAEYAVSAINSLAPKPTTLSFDHAAAVPTGVATAWQGLFDHGQLHAGQRVLIQGAAGGVGALAIQLATLKQAQAIGTTSSKNVAYVRSLGAAVVDYTTTPLEHAVDAVDLVFDAVGGTTVEQSLRVLRPGGALVSITAPPPHHLVQQRGVRSTFFLAQITRAVLETAARLIDDGLLRVTLGASFPLREAWRAHALSQHGHGRGRIVLRTTD